MFLKLFYLLFLLMWVPSLWHANYQQLNVLFCSQYLLWGYFSLIIGLFDLILFNSFFFYLWFSCRSIPRAWFPPCEPHCGRHQPPRRHIGLVRPRASQWDDPILRGPVWERVLLWVTEHILKHSNSDEPEAFLLLQRDCEGVHPLRPRQPNVRIFVPAVRRRRCVDGCIQQREC